MEGCSVDVRSKVLYLLLSWVFMLLAGCGDVVLNNGGSASSSTAVLKLKTSGTPSAKIRGIDITIVLPAGATPDVNSNGSVVCNVSGVAAPGVVLSATNTPATSAAKATLHITMASGIEAGFSEGEYATVVVKVPSGTTLEAAGFSYSDFNPIDISGNTASGISAGFSAGSQ